jgi:hypothetical protein
MRRSRFGRRKSFTRGGAIVYHIPNMAHVSVRLDLLAGRFCFTELGLLDRTYLVFYDRIAVDDVLASAGLMINSELPVITGHQEELINAASCDQNTAKGTYSEGPTRFGTRIVTM